MARKRAATRMRKRLKLTAYRDVAGRYYGTPKELWGFRLAPQKGRPQQVAKAVLRANIAELGLHPKLLDLHMRRAIQTAAGRHVIFEQKHAGTPIHRAYVTVHMNHKNEVYLIKNRAVPQPLLPPSVTVRVSESKARRIAVASVKAHGARVLASEPMWFPVKDRLRFAHKFRVRRQSPPEEWIIFVDAVNGRILSKYDNLATATGRARVFNPNPVVALGEWHPLLASGGPIRRVPLIAYESVDIQDVTRSGRLDGRWATTRPTKKRITARSLNFEFESHQRGFEEVMAYFHVDQAIRYVRSLGYTGVRQIVSRPVAINARATRADESWYSPGTRRLEFGTGDVDDAEDGETILHEFGHALQDAICPDFGRSLEAAAMGEGFGDYFAGSFFAGKKAGRRGKRLIPTVMTWDGILFGSPDDPTRPPCVRRLDSRRTFETFDHAAKADEHDNGEIWSATLWDIWRSVGRNVADRIIIESHFQLDGFTTFARGARAILDADRHLFRGKHVARLKRIFRRRGIGPIE
jgi:hypothetical protein